MLIKKGCCLSLFMVLLFMGSVYSSAKENLYNLSTEKSKQVEQDITNELISVNGNTSLITMIYEKYEEIMYYKIWEAIIQNNSHIDNWIDKWIDKWNIGEWNVGEFVKQYHVYARTEYSYMNNNNSQIYYYLIPVDNDGYGYVFTQSVIGTKKNDILNLIRSSKALNVELAELRVMSMSKKFDTAAPASFREDISGRTIAFDKSLLLTYPLFVYVNVVSSVKGVVGKFPASIEEKDYTNLNGEVMRQNPYDINYSDSTQKQFMARVDDPAPFLRNGRFYNAKARYRFGKNDGYTITLEDAIKKIEWCKRKQRLMLKNKVNRVNRLKYNTI